MAWYTPRRMLVIFCALNMLNYVERGNIASTGVNGRFEDSACSKEQCGGAGQPERDSLACRDLCGYTGIQGDFRLSNADNGLLASLFTVGLTIAAPPSAHMIKYLHPFTVMAVGQAVFTAGLLACGFAQNFTMLLLFRMLVGAAEPSFTVVAPAYIIEAAPDGKRALWLAFYYLCLPVGNAVGYGFGGFFDGTDWRWSMRAQAMVNLPFVLFLALAERVHLRNSAEGRPLIDPAPEPAARATGGGAARGAHESLDEALRASLTASVAAGDLRRSQRASALGGGGGGAPAAAAAAAGGGGKAPPASVCDDIRALRTPQFIFVTLGLTMYTAYFGAVQYWAPKAGAALYPAVEDSIDFLFGAMVVVTGSVGTVAGGLLLDRLGGGFRNGALVSLMSAFVGCVFCGGALWMPPKDPTVGPFFVLMSIGLFCLFVSIAPAGAAILWSVPPVLRPTAMAMSNLILHVFGDVPSPYYYGATQDGLNNWRHTFTIFTPLLFLSGAFFACGWGVGARETHARLTQQSDPDAQQTDIEVPGRAAPGPAP